MKKPTNKKSKKQLSVKKLKVTKIPGLSKVIENQKLFIEQVTLTLKFLKVYQGNPEDFKLLIGSDVWECYQFNIGHEAKNAEWMWESIEEMACDIVNDSKKFTVTHSGIFPTLHFSKKKDKRFMDKLPQILVFGEYGEWAI
jgi:hypothetical protein